MFGLATQKYNSVRLWARSMPRTREGFLCIREEGVHTMRRVGTGPSPFRLLRVESKRLLEPQKSGSVRVLLRSARFLSREKACLWNFCQPSVAFLNVMLDVPNVVSKVCVLPNFDLPRGIAVVVGIGGSRSPVCGAGHPPPPLHVVCSPSGAPEGKDNSQLLCCHASDPPKS